MTEVRSGFETEVPEDTRLADLHRMIVRLGDPMMSAMEGARTLSGSDPVNGLSCVFDEIDETVMARRLLFRNARGESAALEVRNRRLLRADFGKSAREPPGECVTAADTLSYAGADDLAALQAALSRFCNAGGIRVTSEPPLREAALDETGISVATLRHGVKPGGPALQRRSVRGDATGRLHQFCADCTPWAIGWVLRDGGADIAQHGEGDLVRRLSEVLDDFPLTFGTGQDNQPGAVMLSPYSPGLGALGFFTECGSSAAVAAAPGMEDAILEKWAERMVAARVSGATEGPTRLAEGASAGRSGTGGGGR